MSSMSNRVMDAHTLTAINHKSSRKRVFEGDHDGFTQESEQGQYQNQSQNQDRNRTTQTGTNLQDQDHIRRPKRSRSSWTLRAGRSFLVPPSRPESDLRRQAGMTISEANREGMPHSVEHGGQEYYEENNDENNNGTRVQSPVGRPAKFHEGSMNDKPSEKPPSVFTRMFHNHSTNDLAVDRMMEDYVADSSGPAGGAYFSNASQNNVGNAHKNGQVRPGLDRSEVYWDGSTYRSKKQPAPASSVTTTESKESGILRLGRSFVSAINPIGAWQRLRVSWEEAREELIQEDLERQRKLIEQQERAERAYAELKASGQFGFRRQEHRAGRDRKAVISGYSTAESSSFRDSAIMVDERSSIGSGEGRLDAAEGQNDAANDTSHTITAASEVPAPKRGLFHFRTPSLANLKKTRSEAHLDARPTPSVSVSPEKSTPGRYQGRELHKAPSKKDLIKQQRLTKRVSDLETKLAEARRELDLALAQAPPVPPIPAGLAMAPPPRLVEPSTPNRNSFVPGGLPSLPSERLLFPEQLMDYEGSGEDEDDADLGAGDGLNGNREYEWSSPEPDQRHEQEQESDSEHEQEAVQVEVPADPAMNVGEKVLDSVEPGSPDIWAQNAEIVDEPKKDAEKPRGTKKRKSGDKDDLRYKPDSEDDDDAEWDSAVHRTPKRKRAMVNMRVAGPANPAPKSKLPQPAARAPKKPNGTEGKVDKQGASAGALKSSNTSFDLENVQKATISQVQSARHDTEHITSATIFAVHENATLTSVPLADEPSKPTAFATPSQPPNKRPPLTQSPHKSPRSFKTPVSRRMSGSPPPSGSYLGLSPVDEDDVVRVAPGTDKAPPLPEMPKELQENENVAGIGVEEVVAMKKKTAPAVHKEDWEWPDDVF